MRDENFKRPIETIEEFVQCWEEAVAVGRLRGNAYRVFAELVLYGGMTQSDLAEKNDWVLSNISKAIKVLYDSKLIECSLCNRRLVYHVNKDILTAKCDDSKEIDGKKIAIDLDTFMQVWKEIREESSMTANSFLVMIDLVLYGAASQKELLERRVAWKVSSVNQTLHRLHAMEMIKFDTDKNVYYVNFNKLIK